MFTSAASSYDKMISCVKRTSEHAEKNQKYVDDSFNSLKYRFERIKQQILSEYDEEFLEEFYKTQYDNTVRLAETFNLKAKENKEMMSGEFCMMRENFASSINSTADSIDTDTKRFLSRNFKDEYSSYFKSYEKDKAEINDFLEDMKSSIYLLENIKTESFALSEKYKNLKKIVDEHE